MTKNLRWGIDLSTADGIREAEAFFNALKTGGSAAADYLDKRFSGNSKYVIEMQTVVDKDTGLRELVPTYRKLNDEVDKYGRELDKLNKIQDGSLTRLRQQRNEAAQARDSYAKFAQGLNSAGQAQTKLNSDWVAANQRVKELDASLAKAGASNFWQQIKADFNLGPLLSAAQGIGTLVNAFQAVAIVMQQVTGTVGELYNRLSKLQSFGLVFQSIGQGVGGASAALAEANRIALGTGANIDTVRDSFQKVAPAILATGGNIADVSETVQALTTRFVALGKSQDEQRRAFNAVVQVFGKGKLQAEELTQQLGEVDSALKTDLAQAAGVSVAAFEQMVKNGEITSAVFADLIKKIDKTDEVFGKLGPSASSAVQALGEGKVVLQQVLTQFTNLQTLNLQSLAEGLKPFLGQLLALRAAFIDLTTQVINSEAFKTLVAVFNSTSGAINTLLITFINLAGVLLKVIEPFAALLNQLLQIPGISQLIGAAIAGKLIGSLLSLTGVLSENAQKFGGLRGLLIGIADIARGTGETFGKMSQKGGLLKVSIESLSSAFDKSGKTGMTFTQALLATGPAAAQSAAGVAKVATATGGAQGKTGLLAAALNLLGTSLGVAGGQAGGAGDKIDDVGKAAASTATKGGGVLQMALNLGSGFLQLGQKGGKAGEEVTQLGLDLASVGYKATDAATKGGLFRVFLQQAGGLVRFLTGLLNPLTIGLAVLAGAFWGMSENTKAANETTEQSKQAMAGLDAAMKNLGGATEETTQKMNPFTSALGWLGIGLEAVIGGIQIAIKWLADLASTIAGGILSGIQSLAKWVGDLWNKFAGGTLIGQQVNKIFSDIGNALKGLGGVFDGTLVKQYQLNKATEATGKAQIAFGQSLDKTIEAYKREAAASDGSAESKKKLEAAGKEMLGALTAEEARLDALAQQYGLTGKDISEMTEEERLLFQTIQAGKTQVEAGRAQLAQMGITAESSAEKINKLNEELKANAAAIKEANEARMVEIKDDAEERISNLQKEKEKVKEVSDARVEGLQRAKEAAADYHNSVIEKLEAEKQAIADAAEQRLARIEQAKEYETNRHTAAIANLDMEAQAIERKYDRELSRIDELIAAENRRYANQMANINAPSANEQKLKEIEIEKLKVQAMKGATEEERLRAKVALERIDKEKAQQIADANHQQNLANLQAQRAREEEKKKKELDGLARQREAEEKSHKDNMKALDAAAASVRTQQQKAEKALDKEIADEKKKAKETERYYDKQIAAEKKKAQTEEKEIEDKIKKIREDTEAKVKALKQQTKDAQVNLNKSVDDQIKREEYVNKLIERQIQLKKQLAATGGGSGSTSSGTGTTGGTQTNTRGGKFLGGPVLGGAAYTVNELGKEAFLGDSGRLGMINAPAYGRWRAPESGVVIPAHITAGLNIPRGGINVGRGIATARRAGSGSFDGSIAKLLASSLGASQGRVTNNVTIQSQQPVNDASRLLVEMSRLKARRR